MHNHQTTTQAIKKQRRRQQTAATAAITSSHGLPACNTRAQKKVATVAAAPPASNTRARVRASQVRSPTPAMRKPRPGHTTLAENLKGNQQLRQLLAKQITRLENEVGQVMAVMDANSRKMLRYHQLIQHPKNKKGWYKSLANEFGQLANGVGRRIKGTNTIKFIRREDVPCNRMRDVTYGQFMCSV